jgi:hypothetical protein
MKDKDYSQKEFLKETCDMLGLNDEESKAKIETWINHPMITKKLKKSLKLIKG